MLFQDKYQGLPGDLKNATAFWGVMPTGTCSNTAAGASGATGTQTCNGNGSISWSIAVGSNIESLLFWQHLSNAGLVEGKYSGIYNGSYNEMESKIKNVFFITYGRAVIQASEVGYLFEGDYKNTLELDAGINKPLIPAETWGIDKKIDDGLPGIGSVVTLENDGVNCNNVATSASPIAETATYNLDYESAACRIIFKNMW